MHSSLEVKFIELKVAMLFQTLSAWLFKLHVSFETVHLFTAVYWRIKYETLFNTLFYFSDIYKVNVPQE